MPHALDVGPEGLWELGRVRAHGLTRVVERHEPIEPEVDRLLRHARVVGVMDHWLEEVREAPAGPVGLDRVERRIDRCEHHVGVCSAELLQNATRLPDAPAQLEVLLAELFRLLPHRGDRRIEFGPLQVPIGGPSGPSDRRRWRSKRGSRVRWKSAKNEAFSVLQLCCRTCDRITDICRERKNRAFFLPRPMNAPFYLTLGFFSRAF